jgi:methylphosphotriester-DNA--protein-cysteine methyltransferase
LSDVAAFDELVALEPLLHTPGQCIDVLQEFLVRRLAAAQVHGVVAAAVREIELARGRVRIADVAAHCGVSTRHLTRLMRVWVGYGPKRFAAVVRFQETLRQMEQSPGRSGAALASETGYFDQAHLTVDLTRFAGATPGHLLSSCVADFSKTRCDDLP